MEIRLEHIRNLLKRCLDEETLRWVLPTFKMEDMYALIVGHELGHPILVNDKLIKAFGPEKPKIEEAKATLFGIAAIAQAIGPNQINHLGLSAVILAEGLRMMEKELFENATFSPYANESMMLLSALQREGLLVIRDNKVHMDENAAASGRVAQVLYEELTRPIIECYRNKDLSTVRRLVGEFANREDPGIQSIYRAVNE
jgi:hypothetical protein